MNPQSVRLLAYLRNHLYITALEAMNDLGIFRLGARIWDLKQAGIQIQSDWRSDTLSKVDTCGKAIRKG